MSSLIGLEAEQEEENDEKIVWRTLLSHSPFGGDPLASSGLAVNVQTGTSGREGGYGAPSGGLFPRTRGLLKKGGDWPPSPLLYRRLSSGLY